MRQHVGETGRAVKSAYGHRGRCLPAVLIASLAILALDPCCSGAADHAVPQRTKVLRVGMSGDYAPFAIRKGGQFSGFDVELVNRLAADLGLRVEYVLFRWPDLIRDLRARRFDVAVSGVTIRSERALVARFSRPYAITGAMALIRKEDLSRFRDGAALDRGGVRIVVNEGGHLERVARRLFPRATIEPLRDNASSRDRVLLGSANAVLTDSVEARVWQRPELAAVGPFTRDRKAVLVRWDAPELAEQIDAWLRERERDGWLARLRGQWLGDSMFFAAGADREAVLADVLLRCQLMPAVAAMKVAHGLPIEDRAQEGRVIHRARERARRVGLHPDEVALLFDSLIRAATAIQVASGTDPHVFAPPLEQLRVALGEIDEHLIRQLRHAARTVKPAAWAPGIREGVHVEGLSELLKADLAHSLAQVRTLTRPVNPSSADVTPRLDSSRSAEQGVGR